MTDNYKNTISDELIAFLFSARSTSIRKKILWERLQKRRKISKQIYNQNFYRLRKNGLIECKGDQCSLSPKGKKYYKNPYRHLKEKINKHGKIIIIFDIPENKKKARDWLRNQIKFWDFKMIQKSVWIGYGPLPDEFKEHLKLLDIEQNIKTFNIRNKNNQ